MSDNEENLQKQIVYPEFISRMFAGLIDLLLLTLLSTPILKLLSKIIYGNKFPSQVFEEVAKEMIAKNDNTLDFFQLITHPKIYEFYVTNHGIMKAALEWLIQFIIFGIVIIGLWYYKQSTPGKMIISCKIVDAKTLEKPSLKQLIIRYLSYLISITPFCIGLFISIISKKKQALHDKMAGTLVIKK
jgi:uncharacterized RDD family membrane protein YckC